MNTARGAARELRPVAADDLESWQSSSRVAVDAWFRDRHGGDRGELAAKHETAKARIVAARCSRAGLRQFGGLVRSMARLAGWPTPSDRRGVLLGCDWGLAGARLALDCELARLDMLDPSAAGYARVTETLLADRPELASRVSIHSGRLADFAASMEPADLLIATSNVPLHPSPGSRLALATALKGISPGGVVALRVGGDADGITAEELLAIMAEASFADVTWLRDSGAEAAPDVGRYLSAVRSVDAVPPLRSNRAPAALAEAARLQVETWYERSDSLEVAHIRGGDASRMVADTVAAFAGPSMLARFDRLMLAIRREMGWATLEDRRGMVLGCDWGFQTLHVAEEWRPREIVGVDTTGKYGAYGRAILDDNPGLFDGASIREAGPGQLGKLSGTRDFLIALKSFALLDNYIDRREAVRALQTVADGGAVVFEPMRTPGHMRSSDLARVLEAAGCSDVMPLDAAMRPLRAGQLESAAYLFAVKRSAVALAEIDDALDRVGQGADDLVGRRQRIVYPKEDIIERMRRVQQSIRQGKTQLDVLPLRYTMNMLSVCNIKCIFCDYPDRLRHWSLPETFLTDVIDTLDGTLRVQITGGETMLSPKSVEMLKIARAMPYLQLEVITNMTAPRRDLAEVLARGASFITCSIDAASRPTYDKIRQDSNFPRVVSGLKELVRLRDEAGQHYPHVQINFIVMGHNLHEIAAFMDLAREICADSVAYKWLLWTLTPRITEEARFDFSDDAKVRRLCEELREAHRRSLDYGIRAVWGPVPHHIKSERPDLYERYDMDAVFLHEGAPWTNPKHVFVEGPRHDTVAAIDIEALQDTTDVADTMPDGLMPCTAPFTTMQMNGPRNANFCCYSTADYRAIPVDATGGLLTAWNHEKFREARRYFLDGHYDKVCRPHCSLYREYLRRADAADRGEKVHGQRLDINGDAPDYIEAASTDVEH